MVTKLKPLFVCSSHYCLQSYRPNKHVHNEGKKGDESGHVSADSPALGPPAGWPSAPAPPCCTRPGSGTFRRLSPVREAGRWWMLSCSGGASSWGSHRRTVCRLCPVSPGRPRLQRRCWRNTHLRRRDSVRGKKSSFGQVEICYSQIWTVLSTLAY